MVIRSPHPNIPIPDQDILTYLFGDGGDISDSPLWINSLDPRQSLSLRTGLQWIKRLAIGLDKLGVRKGEVVMTVTPNHIFVPIAYLGIVGSGRIFSGANPAYTADEISYQMKNLSAKVVLVYPTLLDSTRRAAEAAGLSENSLYFFSDAAQASIDGIQDWRSIAGSLEEASSFTWPRLTGGEAGRQSATVNYSSGTTGLPKGVMITHDIAGFERWIGFLPLFHAYGQLNLILLATKLINPIYIMTTFVYEDLLTLIQVHRITERHVAPPIVVMLSKHHSTAKYDLTSVKRITCGAAPLSHSLQNETTSRFDLNLRHAWGMTELTCAALSLPIGVQDNSGSVGHLLPNLEINLLDEAGRYVALGDRGEIYIRGPNASPGHWRNDNATKDTMLEGGWIRTGDVAVADEKGWLWIVDRLKEMIKVSGFQVAPAELEAVLLTHPAIADAGVVGAHGSFDAEEKPCAYVQLHQASDVSIITARDIQEWFKGKVAKHKRLTGGVTFVESVPESPAGKIQRKVLREWAKGNAQMNAGRSKL